MDILIAEKHQTLRSALAERLLRAGHRVGEASTSEEVLAAAGNGLRLILLGIDLADGDALPVLSTLRASRPELPVVVMANGATEARVLAALELGAKECLAGEIDPDRLVERLAKFLEADAEGFLSIETHGHRALWTEATREVYGKLRRAALSPALLLITGETGTGKEVAAVTAHQLSPRRSGPFLAVNCPALSAGLMESELFGHEKGAFTNATQRRIGRFEAAAGGTILLDEVSELDLAHQAKLLRVLQEKSFERVGSNEVRRVDVRVIATSNRDLEAEAGAGRFRKDLLYRLKGIHVEMPPLRDRRSEVAPLLEVFLKPFGKRVSPEVVRILERHEWPGNVRELEQLAADWGAMVPRGVIYEEDLPRSIAGTVGGGPAKGGILTLREMEREHVARVLVACDGNQARAAEVLGIPRTTLRTKLASYGLLSLAKPEPSSRV